MIDNVQEIRDSLAAGATQEQAAELAGVSVRTVRRRLEDHGFVALIQQQRHAYLDRASARLAAELHRTTTVLGQIRDDTAAPTSVRVNILLPDFMDSSSRVGAARFHSGPRS